MNIKKIFYNVMMSAWIGISVLAITGCDDTESYADLLLKERKATNAWLANNIVELKLPDDMSKIQTGPDAPYYRVDEEGNIYMQVLNKGNMEDMAKYDQLIYFRFMRASLTDWMRTGTLIWSGNADDMSYNATNFRFDNYSLSSTAQYGTGIQTPLKYLGIGCEVNIVIKSQFGFTEEIAYVTPFVYNIRYFRPQT